MNFYDILLARCLCCKAGSEAEPLNVTENGQYIAPEGKAFNPVTVSVPLPSGTLPITENGIYDVYSYASVDVDVAGGISVDDIATCTISGAIMGSSASYISEYAFYRHSYLTEVSFPACTNIEDSAFYDCRSLAEVNFPVCRNIRESAFCGCYSLAEVNFPACTDISRGAFYDCRALPEVNFPVCRNIGAYAFSACFSLTEASFPVCRNINANAFRSCYNLLSFNLVGVSSVPTLGGSAFYSTPIGGYTGSTGGVYGSVYVPSSLLTAFQTAPNWSLISSRIVGV